MQAGLLWISSQLHDGRVSDQGELRQVNSSYGKRSAGSQRLDCELQFNPCAEGQPRPNRLHFGDANRRRAARVSLLRQRPLRQLLGRKTHHER